MTARRPRAEDEVLYFADLDAWCAWLAEHHAARDAQWVGFHKVGSSEPSIDWAQSVDGALMYGWIDGVRKSVDAGRYKIRFTKRRARSKWSQINVARVAELEAAGRLRPAGKAAFEARVATPAGYSYEQRERPELSKDEVARFRATKGAWAAFDAMPAGYKRVATYWVVSAKRADTRARRLTQLIEDSAAGRKIKQLVPPKGKP